MIETPAEPFAVLGLLRRLEQEKSLNAGVRDELAAAIKAVEESYFAAEGSGNGPDLGELVARWSLPERR